MADFPLVLLLVDWLIALAVTLIVVGVRELTRRGAPETEAPVSRGAVRTERVTTAPVTTFDAALRFLRDHPDPAAVVPCTMPDGSQAWLPASVADDSCRLRARPELSPGAACHDCPWCQAPRSASGPRRRGRGSVG